MRCSETRGLSLVSESKPFHMQSTSTNTQAPNPTLQPCQSLNLGGLCTRERPHWAVRALTVSWGGRGGLSFLTGIVLDSVNPDLYFLTPLQHAQPLLATKCAFFRAAGHQPHLTGRWLVSCSLCPP